MNLSKYIYPFLAFVFISYYTKSTFAAMAIAIIIFIVNQSVDNQNKGSRGSKLMGDNQEFIDLILALTSVIIKADGRVDQSELNIVKHRLSMDYSPEMVQKYMTKLRSLLSKQIRVTEICGIINAHFNAPAKIQLLHFLTSIAVANRYLTSNEYNWLAKIAQQIGVPPRSLQSILAMFDFTMENGGSNKQGSSNSRQQFNRGGSLQNAYKILEVDSSASDAEIKKAYRKLAMLHHPDKVSHLGEQVQRGAKVKFQKISDAYELVKTSRGFN
jgi:DnaJ like chaperone protein